MDNKIRDFVLKKIGRIVQVGMVLIVCSAVAVGQDRMAQVEKNSVVYNGIPITQDVAESTVLNKIISVNIQDVPLMEAVEKIAVKANLEMVYNSKVLAEKNHSITINLEQVTVAEALWAVLEETGLRFAVSADKQLVLLERKEAKNSPQWKLAATQETITGTVTDAQSGETLPGVNILVKGTTTGASTDQNGNFELTVPSLQDTLVVSFIGYQTKEVPINGRTGIDIQLAVQAISGEEMVVVGYGTQQKSDLTGSIDQINDTEFENQANTDIREILSGTIAGVYSNQGTSAAGGGSMRIRGTTSLKASNEPLLVVDGVIYNGDIRDINPSDVESINILKDASAAAIYGSRSASGVVIVTTKKGEMGAPPSINFSAKTGVVGLTNHMRPFGPEEYLQARGEIYRQLYSQRPSHYFTNPNDLPSDISIDEWKNYDETVSDDPVDMWLNRLTLTGTEKKNYLAGNTINWLDKVLQNGIRQDYNASISGGFKNLRYFWSGGYTHNEGYIVGDEFKTVRSRLNLDADVNDFLNLGLNAQFSDRDQGFTSASLSGAITGSPYGQIYSEDGEMEWYTHEEVVSQNPLIYHTYRDRLYRIQSLMATVSGEVELPLGFAYSVSFANRFSWIRENLFDPIETPRGGQNGGYGNRRNGFLYDWQVDNVIKWNKSLSEIHRFDFTFLLNFEKFQSWRDNLTNIHFAPNDNLSFHALGAGSTPSIDSNDEYSTGNALMGRLNYSLMDKYIITLTARRDGYSAFGQDNPYAFFPSAAVAWRVSEEDFFNVRWMDHLKIRASWGYNGNRAIGRYQALARLSPVDYLYGDRAVTGVYTSNMANSSLKWERTEAYNFGVEFGLFQDRLSASVDGYYSKTKDLLMDRSLPSIMAYSSVATNLGEVHNKGIEITINSRNITIPNGFNWNSSLNFSLNRNKIKSLYGDMVDVVDENGDVVGQREVDDRQNGWFIGKSIHRIWDYKIQGIWQEDEAEEAAIYGEKPGYFKLKDVNGDGVLNPQDDKVFQGYTEPRYRLGLENNISYRNFDLSMFIRADLGFYKNHSIDKQSSWIDRRNIYKKPYWTSENPSNEYTRLNTAKNTPYEIWKNSSFLRLQNVSFSYNLPESILTTTKFKNVKVFLNLRNYYTITGWDHWDPESGTNPMPKYATFGLDVNL